jgi:D-xylose transport system permease protein
MGPDRELPMTTVPGETAAVVSDTTTTADLTAAPAPEAAAEVGELVAQSLGQYLRAWLLKVRSGDSGVLPVLLAMVVVAVTFQVITPEHSFLRPSNLVYIFGLSTVYMVLAIAETVVLLIAEIDLSVGAVALIGGVIAFKLVQQPGAGWPWWAAILAAVVACGVFGALQGVPGSRSRPSS